MYCYSPILIKALDLQLKGYRFNFQPRTAIRNNLGQVVQTPMTNASDSFAMLTL